MGTNQAKLYRIFAESLGIDEAAVVPELAYNTIKEWDSVAHMALINALEEAFDIMLDTEEIIDMSSVAVAEEILQKYDIEFGDA